MAYVAKIKLPGGGVLAVTGSLRWKGNKAARAQVEVAKLLTDGYTYSPSHGFPGVRLAHEVAKVIGGRVIVGDLPESKDGEVY